MIRQPTEHHFPISEYGIFCINIDMLRFTGLPMGHSMYHQVSTLNSTPFIFFPGNSETIPCIFLLLKNKSQEGYALMLNVLCDDPVRVLQPDCRLRACSYIGIQRQVSSCFFHLAQKYLEANRAIRSANTLRLRTRIRSQCTLFGCCHFSTDRRHRSRI